MKPRLRHKWYALFIVVLFVISMVPVCSVVKAQTVDAKTESKVLSFINDVMAIDVSRYEITERYYGSSNPSKYGGSVKEEHITIYLSSSDGSKIKANAVFDNGYIYNMAFTLYGPVASEQAYNVSSLEKARNVLVRYQGFTSKLGVSSGAVPEALNMLSSVSELSSQSVTSGNMNMDIKNQGPISDIRLDYNIKFRFFYTENGVVNTWKCLAVGFDCSYGITEFLFSDTWGLFSVDSNSINPQNPSYVSEADAKEIAWDAAKNYQITLVNSTTITPVWPETLVVDFSMNMVSGQALNDSWAVGMDIGSRERDGLTLYPLWQFLFYFDEPIGSMQGIQVGVWGDTKEIAYCDSYGFYGQTYQVPTPTPVVFQLSASNIVYIAAVLAVAITITAAIIVLKKRKTPAPT